MTWHTINWVRLGVEILRIVIAALAGFTGAEVTAPGRVEDLVQEELQGGIR